VTVSYGGATRSKQAGASGEEAAARRLLYELTADFERPAR
jgi:hypothetical protein